MGELRYRVPDNFWQGGHSPPFDPPGGAPPLIGDRRNHSSRPVSITESGPWKNCAGLTPCFGQDSPVSIRHKAGPFFDQREEIHIDPSAMKKITLILSILIGYLLSTVPCHAYRDLETGAFLTRDPADFVDGPNVYTYVNQNPWTSFDPDGLAEFKIGSVYFKFFQDGVMGTGRMADEGDSHVSQLFSLGNAKSRVAEFRADPKQFVKDLGKGYMNPDNAPSNYAGASGKVIAVAEAIIALGRNFRMPHGLTPGLATANGGVVQGNGTVVATPPSIPAGTVFQNNQGSKAEGATAKDTSNSNAAKGPVPLKRLHTDKTLENDPTSSLDSQRTRTTEDIVKSLEPGAKEPLRVKYDGTIMDGNTRQKVLEERGVETNKLPRVEWKETKIKEPWE